MPSRPFLIASVLLLLTATLPAHAKCPPSFRQMVAGWFARPVPPAIPVELTARLRETRDGEVDPNGFTKKWTEEAQPGYHVMRLFHDGEFIGLGAAEINKGTLRFDIQVSPRFRGTKLYPYFLAEALVRFPETKLIASVMPYEGSVNAKLFIDGVFGSKEAFAKFQAGTLDAGAMVRLRQKMFTALNDNPAYKSRKANGFGTVTRVVLIPGTGDFGFEVARGEPTSLADLKIFVRGESSFEITPGGPKKVDGLSLQFENYRVPVFPPK